MSTYILVTGSVHADIGKGTVASMIARDRARRGERVEYVKIDPCLQGPIDKMPSSAFGEIARTRDGVAIDIDVARAAFLVPHFAPTEKSQRSLGCALAKSLSTWHGTSAPSPRLLDGLIDLVQFDPSSITVVEVGGSAGEPEHALVLEALRRHAGLPLLHVHVTGLLRAVDGRPTSKPAQIAMQLLSITPNIVLARGDQRAMPQLCAAMPSVEILPLEEDAHNPEYAAQQALVRAKLLEPAALAEFSPTVPLGNIQVAGCDDETSVAGLALRVRLWSQGKLQLRCGLADEAVGVVCLVPASDPLPKEQQINIDAHSSEFTQRPDWQGTLDDPEGPLVSWIQQRCQAVLSDASQEIPSSPYAVPAFAERYLIASEQGNLRDHAVLDSCVRRAMGKVDGQRVLDLGCGAGRWSKRLAAEGATVVGVEPAAPMIARARALALDRVTLVQASAETYVPEGRFDGVLASMSLDHVEDLAPVLRRLSAHLSDGGWLIVTTEHPIRTAPRRGRRWIDEGETRSARVRDYCQRGWRMFEWFGRPEPVAVFHRTFGEWVELLSNTALELVEVREPVSAEARDGANPRFWMLHARRRLR